MSMFCGIFPLKRIKMSEDVIVHVHLSSNLKLFSLHTFDSDLCTIGKKVNNL